MAAPDDALSKADAEVAAVVATALICSSTSEGEDKALAVKLGEADAELPLPRLVTVIVVGCVTSEGPVALSVETTAYEPAKLDSSRAELLLDTGALKVRALLLDATALALDAALALDDELELTLDDDALENSPPPKAKLAKLLKPPLILDKVNRGVGAGVSAVSGSTGCLSPDVSAWSVSPNLLSALSRAAVSDETALSVLTGR